MMNERPSTMHPQPNSVESSRVFEASSYDSNQRLYNRYTSPGLHPATTTLSSPNHRPRKSRKPVVFATIATVVISIFLAVFLPVYFLVIRDGSSSSSTITSGGDGSTVQMANGSTFVYRNAFGGFWVHDPQDPFNSNARPNSWTRPLNETWRWGEDRIYGVNLGGLFVLEPFISPEIFQRYPGARDEWTLSEAMAADEANGGLRQIEEHYDTFITEQDIAEIAGAGLNWLRIPLGYWVVETWDGEPFLSRTSWTYFLRVVEWARKYGLRVMLDLHAVPGSQNGLNHSGRLGVIEFLSGNLGIANAERTLDYLRVLTQYISQPQYRSVIQAIGLVNEPLAGELGLGPLSSFYLRAYDILRNVTGYGEGNGPYIVVQDGLQSLQMWHGLLPGGDRIIMDGHSYFAFGGDNPASMLDTAEDGLPGGTWPALACRAWGGLYNESRNVIGPTICGEFSGAPNDCGLFIRAVGVESTHPQCAEYNDWENYSPTMKAGLQSWIMASFDAFGDFFFWTWKIGPSQAGRVEAPLWSYKLGLENGWIPRDPRTSVGKCAGLGVPLTPVTTTFQPHRTGAVPSPTVDAAYSIEFPWPPTSIPNAQVPVNLLPTYTNTAPVPTLPVPAFSGASPSSTGGMDGWYNDDDTVGGIAPVEGCTYPTGNPAMFDVVPVEPCVGA